MATRALLLLPPALRAGEVFEVRAAVQHPMETGYRVGSDGQAQPRNLVRRVEALLDGQLVFAADLHPSIAANPWLAFTLRAVAGASLTVVWRGDAGFEHRESAGLNVV